MMRLSRSLYIVQSSLFLCTISFSTTTSIAMKVIDSHLHIWATSKESTQFPYFQEPPGSLKDVASTECLLQCMNDSHVDGALIVQPINHKFDHSYLIQAIKEHPDKFKGMLLHDPELDASQAVSRLEELALQGFVGVRYNPYLWPKDSSGDSWLSMCDKAGMAVYKRCGELEMPVGIMCFQGLSLHFNDILKFLQESPKTRLILDHFAFTSIKKDESSFELLLSLAQYPSVYVKVSALFRLDDVSPYRTVYERRFLKLLEMYGANRLLYGSDFPYVMEQPEQYNMNALVSSWCKDDDTKSAIMGGTAETLFGQWT